MPSRSTQSFVDRALSVALAAVTSIAPSGCGSGAAIRVEGTSASRQSVGTAVALVWTIEGHASSCSLTRPTLFSDARRSLLARFHPELALGYVLDVDDLEHADDAPRPIAFARCVVGDEHASREHTMLRFARALTLTDRAAIAEALPFEARWSDEPCDTLTCGWRAIRVVLPDTIEIEGPPRPGIDTSHPDVRRLLAAEVAAHPEVFEVTAHRAGDSRVVVLASLERSSRGITHVRRFLGTAQGAGDTLDTYEQELLRDALLEITPRHLPEYVEFRVHGRSFEEVVRLPWSSLEAIVADEDLERRTRVRRAARDRILPLDQIDLDEPDALRRQAGARALASRVSRDHERRRVWADERATLLERLFVLTEDLATAIDALAIRRELGAPDRAHELATRLIELAPEDPRARQAFVDTAAGEALDAAIGALRPDLSEAERGLLVRGVLSTRERGETLSFSTLEASFDVARATAPAPTSRLAPIEIPRDGLAEVVYLLLRMRDPHLTVGPLAVRVEGNLASGAPSGSGDLGARWSTSAGATFASVRAPARVARVQWLSQFLAGQLPSSGEVRVSAFLRLGDEERTLSLRLAIDGARVSIVGASVALPPSTWTELARDVLRPAVRIPATAFPPPELRLTLAEPIRSRIAARVIGERASGLAGGVCRLENETLACVGHERGAEALLDVLAIVANETLRR